MILRRFKVSGHSMEPILKEGRTVFVLTIFKGKTNDIVVYRSSSKYLVKRITQVKDSRFFLQGDNKKDSLDSRKLGWVEKKDVIGKVLFI